MYSDIGLEESLAKMSQLQYCHKVTAMFQLRYVFAETAIEISSIQPDSFSAENFFTKDPRTVQKLSPEDF